MAVSKPRADRCGYGAIGREAGERDLRVESHPRVFKTRLRRTPAQGFVDQRTFATPGEVSGREFERMDVPLVSSAKWVLHHAELHRAWEAGS